MKNILFLFAACLLGLASSAHAQDVKARKIVAATQQKLNRLHSLKANFSVQIVAKNGKSQPRQKGNIALKGSKFHITLPGQEIISDGKTIWTLLKEAKEVQVSNSEGSEESMSPTKLFTQVYDPHNAYRYLGTKKVAGKLCDLIEMKPSKPGSYSRVELAINPAYEIAGGTIFQKDGSQYRYEISATHLNPSLPESLFQYNAQAHPGMEVVDLR